MNINARWGGAFALLAAALAGAMVALLQGAHVPAPPQTTLEYEYAYRPLLSPMLRLFALDQMFVTAYGAAFVAAALSWGRPALLCAVAILAGLATAGIDTQENLRSVAVLAGLADGPPSAADLDALDFLGAIKWIAAGVTGVSLALLVPRRGIVSGAFALLFGLDGLASVTLGAARLHFAPALSALEPSLAGVVIAGMPVGLLLLGLLLLFQPRETASPADEEPA